MIVDKNSDAISSQYFDKYTSTVTELSDHQNLIVTTLSTINCN